MDRRHYPAAHFCRTQSFLLTLTSLKRTEAGCHAEADGLEQVVCPQCRTVSRSRHSRYWRTLRDLPAQGSTVTLRVRVSRWSCRNSACQTKFFSQQLPGTATAYARQTNRASAVTLVVGQALGGRAAEHLMNRLGMPISDDTIRAPAKANCRSLRKYGSKNCRD